MTYKIATYIVCSSEVEKLILKTGYPLHPDYVGSYVFNRLTAETGIDGVFKHTVKYARHECLWIIITDCTAKGIYISDSEMEIIRKNNGTVVHIHVSNHPAPVIVDTLVTHITTSLTNLPRIMRCAEMFRHSNTNSMRPLEIGIYLSHSTSPRHTTFCSTHSKFNRQKINKFMRLCGHNPNTARSLIGKSACGSSISLGMWNDSINEFTSVFPNLNFTEIGYKISTSLRCDEILMSITTCSNNLNFIAA
jgi:hypothetical protein